MECERPRKAKQRTRHRDVPKEPQALNKAAEPELDELARTSAVENVVPVPELHELVSSTEPSRIEPPEELREEPSVAVREQLEATNNSAQTDRAAAAVTEEQLLVPESKLPQEPFVRIIEQTETDSKADEIQEEVPQTVPDIGQPVCSLVEPVLTEHARVKEQIVQYPVLPALMSESCNQSAQSSHKAPITDDQSYSQSEPQQQLLTEEQLRSFYLNERLEHIEDLVQAFVQNELEPQPCTDQLFVLVARYCHMQRELDTEQHRTHELWQTCSQLQHTVWLAQQSIVQHTAQCGDGRVAKGTAKYDTYEYQSKTEQQLRVSLSEWRNQLQLCAVLEAECRALHLQVHWMLTHICDNFYATQPCPKEAPDSHTLSLVLNAPEQMREHPGRQRIRFCLSVLFYHLRVPLLASAFVHNVKQWITLLAQTLHSCCTELDQLVMLCHLLRCGVQLSDWAIGLFRPAIEHCVLAPVPDHHTQVQGVQVHDQLHMTRALCIDHTLALLHTLLAPITKREEFLNKCTMQSEPSTAVADTWTIVDEDGEDIDAHLYAPTDADLVALIAQFSFEQLFSNVLAHWPSNEQSISQADVLSLFAFELTLMKELSDGIANYNTPKYEQFCKRIAHIMRQSVRYVCSYWSWAQRQLQQNGLHNVVPDLQAELDRVLLFTVHCLVSAPSLNIWQFLVDLPYQAASVCARLRCLVLLCAPTTYRFAVLMQMDMHQLQTVLQEKECLERRLRELCVSDGVCLLSTMCSVVCACTNSTADANGDNHAVPVTVQDNTINQMFSLCFVHEELSVHYAKVGVECMSRFVQATPPCMTRLLRLIDTHADHLQEMLTTVLSLCELQTWKPTVHDIQLLGKWLLTRATAHPLNKLGRFVLSAVNWGYKNDHTNECNVCASIHTAAVDVVTAAHRQHCNALNGMLSAGIKKALKVVKGIPDTDQQFDAFCWHLLLKLKIERAPEGSVVPALNANDTTCFYVHIVKHCMHSLSVIEKEAFAKLNALLDAGCFAAVIVLLCEIVNNHHKQIQHLLDNTNVRVLLDSCAHADQSSLAAVLPGLLGDWQTHRGRYLRLLQSAITYGVQRAVVYEQGCILCAWLHVLTECRPDWATDHELLLLVDGLLATLICAHKMVMPQVHSLLTHAYKNMITWHKQAGRGVLSWMAAAEPAPVSLCRSDLMGTYPWFALLAIQIEMQVNQPIHDKLHQIMLKQPSLTLEQALKKALGKLGMSLSIEQLGLCQCVNLVSACEHSSVVLPLACQLLAIQLLRTYTHEQNSRALASTYLQSNAMSTRLQQTLQALQGATQYWIRTDDPLSLHILYDAVHSWLNTCSQTDGAREQPLDYLHSLAASGDTELWMNYVSTEQIRKQTTELNSEYMALCDLRASSTGRSNTRPANVGLDVLRAQLSEQSTAHVVHLPCVSVNVPAPVTVHVHQLSNCTQLIALITTHTNALTQSASRYHATNERLAELDKQLVQMLPGLYTAHNKHVTVTVTCQPGLMQTCQKPAKINVPVQVLELSRAVHDRVQDNRSRAQQHLAGFQQWLCEEAPMHMAALHVICQSVLACPDVLSQQSGTCPTGVAVFYHLLSVCSQSQTSTFPLTQHLLSELILIMGQRYICNVSACQVQLLHTILHTAPMAHLLLPHFTPTCLAAPDLIELYAVICEAVRMQSLSVNILLQLLSQFDMASAVYGFDDSDVQVLLPMSVRLSSAKHNTQLQTIATEHLLACALCRPPAFILVTFRLLLESCVSETQLSGAVLNAFVQKLVTPDNTLHSTDTVVLLNAQLSVHLLNVLVSMLTESRVQYQSQMVCQWTPYLPVLCGLAQRLIGLCVANADLIQPMHMLQNDLASHFQQCVSVYGVLLEPLANGHVPWTGNDQSAVQLVLSTFCDCLHQVHSVYEQVLPSHMHMDNIPSLFCVYFTHKYSTSPIPEMYSAAFIKLPWNSFRPSVTALQAMQQVMQSGANTGRVFLCNVLVRVQWMALIDVWHDQPVTTQQSLFTPLLTILVHAASKTLYSADCKASLPKVLDQLCAVNMCVEESALNALLSWVGEQYPVDTDTQTAASDSALQLLRVVCYITPNTTNTDYEDKPLIARKQTMMIQCELRLLARSLNAEHKQHTALTCIHILTRIDQVLADASVNKCSCALTDLVVDWVLNLRTTCSIDGVADCVLSELCTWVLDNAGRCVVLMFAHNCLSSTEQLCLLDGVRLLHCCLTAYFQSDRKLVCWSEAVSYVRVPCGPSLLLQMEPALLAPHLLSVHATFMHCAVLDKSTGQVQAYMQSLSALLQAVQPTMVMEEAALLVLVYDLLMLLDKLLCVVTALTDRRSALNMVLTTLAHLANPKQHGSLLTAIGIQKKCTFPTRMRLVCSVLRLYCVQQSIDQPDASIVVRHNSEHPVLNARIMAANELCSHKSFQPFMQSLPIQSQTMTYFTDVTHHISHATALLLTLCKALYIDRYLVHLDNTTEND